MDHGSLIATLVIATAVLGSVTLVLSRIIPDDYDRRVPARIRATSRRSPRR